MSKILKIIALGMVVLSVVSCGEPQQRAMRKVHWIETPSVDLFALSSRPYLICLGAHDRKPWLRSARPRAGSQGHPIPA